MRASLLALSQSGTLHSVPTQVRDARNDALRSTEALGLARQAFVVCARRRSNMAHIRQLRPDSGLGFQAKVRQTVYVVSLRSAANQRWCLDLM